MHKQDNRLPSIAREARMVSKNMAGMIRDWYKKGYKPHEIAQLVKLPEDLVKAIINPPTTAEEWNRKIFSNHH